MSSEAMTQPGTVARAIRTPRAAALAGIAFSVPFAIALVLVRTAVPADPGDAGAWLSDSSRRDAVLLALGFVPVAGIGFLWFVGVLRDRVGEAEDRFYAMRMAGVFTLATSTILLRTRRAPRWLVASGYVVAVALLLTVGYVDWIELVFPAWMFVLSVYVLVVSFRKDAEAVGAT
jgi:hypothetical protein